MWPRRMLSLVLQASLPSTPDAGAIEQDIDRVPDEAPHTANHAINVYG